MSLPPVIYSAKKIPPQYVSCLNKEGGFAQGICLMLNSGWLCFVIISVFAGKLSLITSSD